MLYKNARVPAQVAGLFQIRRMLKALPYSQSSSRTIPLSDCIYILAFKVEEGSLIRQGHIFN
jgi:hypothetical protein